MERNITMVKSVELLWLLIFDAQAKCGCMYLVDQALVFSMVQTADLKMAWLSNHWKVLAGKTGGHSLSGTVSSVLSTCWESAFWSDEVKACLCVPLKVKDYPLESSAGRDSWHPSGCCVRYLYIIYPGRSHPILVITCFMKIAGGKKVHD